MKIEAGHSVIVSFSQDVMSFDSQDVPRVQGSREYLGKQAIIIMKKEEDGKKMVRAKADRGREGSLYTWIDEACVKEVLKVPKITKGKLFE